MDRALSVRERKLDGGDDWRRGESMAHAMKPLRQAWSVGVGGGEDHGKGRRGGVLQEVGRSD
jgi:hypothetical protein